MLESTTYPGHDRRTGAADSRKRRAAAARSTREQAGRMSQPISISLFRPSAKIPATSNTAWRRFPKLWAASIPPSGRAAAGLVRADRFERSCPVSSTRAAEMVKLLENIFRCVNIALVNELKLLSLRMGLDIWEVIDSAATKPFGFMPFYPGPGLGGHCIPVDPYYLSWKAREFDFATRFIELAGEINTAMPYHVVNSRRHGAERAAEEHQGVEDFAARRGVQERRGRSARIAFAEAAELLTERGAQARLQRSVFSGAAQDAALRFFADALGGADARERLRRYDCVLIATDHTSATITKRLSATQSWWWIRATPRGASNRAAKKSCFVSSAATPGCVVFGF